MSYKPQRTFMGSEGEYSVDDRGPEALKQDLDNLMSMFDPTAVHPDGSTGGINRENLAFDLNGADMAGTIGGKLDGVAMTVQQIADTLLTMVKERYTKLESDAKLKEKTDPLLKSMSYDPATGVLKVTTESGVETQVFDLNIEKIPASISILREGNAVFIRIVNDDGTYTQSDVTDLLSQYSFIESVTLKPTISKNGANTSVKYEIKDASIKLAHLSSEVLSTITNAVEAAQLSASNANSSAVNAANSKAAAELSESNAAASKNAASGYASKAEESSDRAATHENNAKEYAVNASKATSSAEENAKLSKSYAVGGTGIREGENTDNAKHYYEQAKATVSAGGLTVFIQSTEPDVNNCLWFKTANTNTQIGALLNVKDASGTVNEIYLITKAENVQGLSQLISDSLLGYAKKTDLDVYATELEVDTKLKSYLPKSGGTMTGPLTLKGEPTADLQAVTKKYVDDKAPLIIDTKNISNASGVKAALNLINVALGNRDVILFQNSVPARYYSLSTVSTSSAIFASVENKKIYTATLSFDADSISYDVRNISATQRTVTLSSTGWTANGDVYTQTATVSGVSATETAQEIHVTPATASMTAYMEAGVYASAQAANQITFTASEKPAVDLTVYAVIRTL